MVHDDADVSGRPGHPGFGQGAVRRAAAHQRRRVDGDRHPRGPARDRAAGQRVGVAGTQGSRAASPGRKLMSLPFMGCSQGLEFCRPRHHDRRLSPAVSGTFPCRRLTGTILMMLIGIAGSCFVMIVAQSAATARVYAVRHQQPLDENDDIVGLAAANAAAAISGTFVVNGSPTQTAMVESSGGRSQFAQICTAGIVAVVLLALTAPVQYLPRCVLGSIVFIIAIKLVASVLLKSSSKKGIHTDDISLSLRMSGQFCTRRQQSSVHRAQQHLPSGGMAPQGRFLDLRRMGGRR